MRRKYRIIAILCVIVLVLTGISWVMKNSIGFSTGTCIAADNGRFLVVIDNSPIAMYQRSGRGSLFSDLDTGDKIFLYTMGSLRVIRERQEYTGSSNYPKARKRMYRWKSLRP